MMSNNIDSMVYSHDVNLFGKDLLLKGEFHLAGLVRIDSEVHGTIFMNNPGKIIFEQQAKVFGDLFVHDLEILGTINGNIESKGNVIIRSSANITGKINAKNICIHPGAILNFEGHTEL